MLFSFLRACYGVLRFIMESGAKGCEVVVSGKLRGQRAKSMKFVDGLMIHSGEPTNDYVDTATRHVLLRQGMLISLLVFFLYYCEIMLTLCSFIFSVFQVFLVSRLRSCCHGILMARQDPRSLCLIMYQLWNLKKRSFPPCHLVM